MNCPDGYICMSSATPTWVIVLLVVTAIALMVLSVWSNRR